MPLGRTAAACLLLLPLSGCVSSPLATRTAGFAAAGAPALTSTRAAYTLVQTVHAGAATAARVAAYDTTSIDTPAPPVAFGTQEDLRVRDEVLGLLLAYVADLNDASSGRKIDTAAQTAAKDSGAALGRLADSDVAALRQATPATPALTTPEMQGVSTAIGLLDGLVVARARRRALPRILRQADGPVTTLCTTLRRDFGQPGGPGLRSAVHTDYEHWITLEDAAIRDHAGAYSYPEKQAAVQALFTLQAQERDADATLVQADAALAQFAATHHALALSAAQPGSAAGFHTLLGQLVIQARQLTALEKKDTASRKDAP